jgi:hypothetical protein
MNVNEKRNFKSNKYVLHNKEIRCEPAAVVIKVSSTMTAP